MKLLLASAPEEARLSLLAHTLPLIRDDAAVPLVDFLIEPLPWNRIATVISEQLPAVTTSAARVAVFRALNPNRARPLRDLPEGLAFLRQIATDTGVPLEVRRDAVTSAGDGAVDWFDWPDFLRSDDPLRDCFVTPVRTREGKRTTRSKMSKMSSWIQGRPAEQQTAIVRAALESSSEKVRAWAVEHYPHERPDFREVLRRHLADSSAAVRGEALERVKRRGLVELAPALIEMLDDPDRRSHRLAVIDILGALAVPESLEPLARLLGDPDPRVRGEAREAMREIRSRLEEQQEWRQLLDDLETLRAARRGAATTQPSTRPK